MCVCTHGVVYACVLRVRARACVYVCGCAGSCDVIFGETKVPGVADHAFGVIHRGARDMPNFLRMIASKYPKTEVRRELHNAAHMQHSRA
jgi:hypothetical protein